MKRDSPGMLNLDTHILIAVLQGDLSSHERAQILTRQLAISDIVNWEIAKLVELDRIRLNFESKNFQEFHASLMVFPITLEIALESTRLDFKSDPADEIIAATSVVHDIPLLTRDGRILRSKMVPLIPNEGTSL